MSQESIETRDEHASAVANQHCFTPRVDIWETSEALHLELEMPGVGPDDVDVRLEDQVLSVLGRVAPNELGERLHGEYKIGNFERAFRISERIDGGKIQARMRNGVLNLTLPKAEVAKPKRIAVKSA
jgi:HSP20 family molecular chaperone IbpA